MFAFIKLCNILTLAKICDINKRKNNDHLFVNGFFIDVRIIIFNDLRILMIYY